MLLNILKDLIQEDPLREEINLENKGLSLIDTNSVDLLGRLKNLKVLNLAENHLTKLPRNLQVLSNLNEINVNGNPFEDIQDVVDSLKTVGPNLKCLQINLFEEDQVDYLLRNLDHMQILNGLKVERDTLFADEEESSELETEEKAQDQDNYQQREEEKQPADSKVIQMSEVFPKANDQHKSSEDLNHRISLTQIGTNMQTQALGGGTTKSEANDQKKIEMPRQKSAHFGRESSGGTSKNNATKMSQEHISLNQFYTNEQQDQSQGKYQQNAEKNGEIIFDYPMSLNSHSKAMPLSNGQVTSEEALKQQSILSGLKETPSPQEAEDVYCHKQNTLANGSLIPPNSQMDQQHARTRGNSEAGTPDKAINPQTQAGKQAPSACLSNETLDKKYLQKIHEGEPPGDYALDSSLHIADCNNSQNTIKKPNVAGVIQSELNDFSKKWEPQAKYSPVLKDRRSYSNKPYYSNCKSNQGSRSNSKLEDSRLDDQKLCETFDEGDRSRSKSKHNRQRSSPNKIRWNIDPKIDRDGDYPSNIINLKHLSEKASQKDRSMSKQRSKSKQSGKSSRSGVRGNTDVHSSIQKNRSQQSLKSDPSNKKISQASNFNRSSKINIKTDKNQIINKEVQSCQAQMSSIVEDLTTPQYENKDISTSIKINLSNQQSKYKSNQSNQAQKEPAQKQQQMLVYDVEPLDILKPINVEESDLSSSDLESITIIYDKIRQIHKQFMVQSSVKNLKSTKDQYEIAAKIAQTEDQKLATDFDSHLTKIMTDLNEQLRQIQDKEDSIIQNCFQQGQKDLLLMSLQFSKQSLIMETKDNLIRLCYQKTRELTNQSLIENNTLLQKFIIDQESITSNLISYQQQIQEKHFNIVKAQNNLLFELQNGHLTEMSMISQDNEEIKTTNELQQIQIQELQMKLQYQEQSNQQTSSAEKTSPINQSYLAQQYSNQVSQSYIHQQANNKAQQLKALEDEDVEVQENSFQTGIKKRANSKKVSKKATAAMNTPGNNAEIQFVNSNQSSVIKKKAQQANLDYPHQHVSNPGGCQTIVKQLRFEQAATGGNVKSEKVINNQHHQKLVPLKQLKDIINDIYSQKIKYDKKCRDSKLPIETMEQFMYTYLNQKYGLKALIIEWASTVIGGIKQYLNDDHEIALFAKILKNECDEDFRFIQMHVRDSLSGMLRQVLREKYPLKSEPDIAKECEIVQNSTIEDWQWRKILYKMYEPEDANMLWHNFNELQKQRIAKNEHNQKDEINGAQMSHFEFKKTQTQRYLTGDKKQQQSASSHAKKRPKSRPTRDEERRQYKQQSKLLYVQEFQKGILDFQLQEHEKFLFQFNLLFKQVDKDNNGVINEREFRELILSMNVVVQDSGENDLDALLRVIDPHNNQQITYTELVQLLSNQLVPQAITNSQYHPYKMQSESDIVQHQSASQHTQVDNTGHNSYLQTPQSALLNIDNNHNALLGQNFNNNEPIMYQQQQNQVRLVPILEKFFNFQSSQNLQTDQSLNLNSSIQQQNVAESNALNEDAYNQTLLGKIENRFNNDNNSSLKFYTDKENNKEVDSNIAISFSKKFEKLMAEDNHEVGQSCSQLKQAEYCGADIDMINRSSDRFSDRQLIGNMNIGNVQQQMANLANQAQPNLNMININMSNQFGHQQ